MKPKTRANLQRTLLDCYKRDGTPCTVEEWGELSKRKDYKILARTVLSDGKVVSTVWLGFDHGIKFENHLDCYKPIIFETMVFSSSKNFGGLDSMRYCTEKEALIGHKKLVKKWSRAKISKTQTNLISSKNKTLKTRQ